MSKAVSHHLRRLAAIRETVEQLAIILVVFFLYQTFVAEAYVIPTGSMAPTLMGRHKDITCPKCGCIYQVGSSEEVNPESGAPQKDALGRAIRILAGTCPMCRYTADLGSNNPQQKSYPSCNGDRIEVSKFAYQIGEPDRWDVIVFKYPGDPLSIPPAMRTDARTNFVKRLVGLPGETIRIQNGDIWIRDQATLLSRSERRQFSQPTVSVTETNLRGDDGFTIARKPPQKVLAMLQPVFDNDYMAAIAKYDWPARWHSDPPTAGGTSGGWTSDDYTTFHIDGTAAGERWLRYHHLVPSHEQWQQAESGRSPGSSIVPQLITDFTAYDTRQYRADSTEAPPEALGVHWVGDLAVACSAEVESPQGHLTLELCKGGRQFQCRFDLSTGRATLSISGQDMKQWQPTAQTNVRGKGQHKILFSNCDDQLLLWVDGSVVSFDAPTAYQNLRNTQPDDADLAPVGVAAAGARVRFSHLRILRDIYYSAVRGEGMPRENFDVQYRPGNARPGEGLASTDTRHVDFALQLDQFFALGDNSVCSKDGRLWGHDSYWVPRELLLGKALIDSWPRSSCNIPFVNISFPVFPNFNRMGLIR